MGFAANQDDVLRFVLRQSSLHFFGEGGKARFFKHWGIIQQHGHIGNGFAQAFRVLLREDDGQRQVLAALNPTAACGGKFCRLMQHGQQPLLNIDHQHNGILMI